MKCFLSLIKIILISAINRGKKERFNSTKVWCKSLLYVTPVPDFRNKFPFSSANSRTSLQSPSPTKQKKSLISSSGNAFAFYLFQPFDGQYPVEKRLVRVQLDFLFWLDQGDGFGKDSVSFDYDFVFADIGEGVIR